MLASRRKFLTQSGMLLAGAAVLPHQLLANFASNSVLGVQLYSVREDMKKDPLQWDTKMLSTPIISIENSMVILQKSLKKYWMIWE
jgi:hypothetical protein